MKLDLISIETLRSQLTSDSEEMAYDVANQIIALLDRDFHRQLYWEENKAELDEIRREHFQNSNIYPIVRFK